MLVLFVMCILLATAAACSKGSGRSIRVAVTNIFPVRQGIFGSIVDEFRKANPDIKVNVDNVPIDSYYTVVPTQISAGNVPDVMLLTGGYGTPMSVSVLAKAGKLADLSGQSWAAVPDEYRPELGVNGRVFGIPTQATFVATVYNVDVFKRLSATPPTTFNQLLSLCGKFSDAGITPFAFPAGNLPIAGQAIYPLAASEVYATNPDFAQQRLDAQATFAGSDGWHTALGNFSKMKDAKCFSKGAVGDSIDAAEQQLAKGDAAMMIFASSGVSVERALSPKAHFAMFPIPGATSETTRLPYGNTAVFGVAKTSKHKSAALAFLRFLDRPDNIKKMSTGSALPFGKGFGPGVEPRDFELVRPLLDQGKTVLSLDELWPNPEVAAALQRGAQQLLTGQSNPNGILTAMDKAFDAK